MKRLLALLTLAALVCCQPTARFGATGANRAPVVISANTTYYIDGQNTLGCASDSNTGTSATCGASGSGIGPLLTYGKLHDVIWNCAGPLMACPTVRSATVTVSFVSGSATNDWIFLDPALDQGIVVLNATTHGTSIATGTISNFAALNRATATGLLTEMQIPAPGVGLVNASAGYPLTTPTPQLVVDTTAAKQWWVYKQQSGAVYFTTTPMVPYTAPNIAGTQYSVSNPANTDAVTIYNPIAVNFARSMPTMVNWDTNQNAGVWIQGLRFLAGSAPAQFNNIANDAVIGSYVSLLDDASDRTILKIAQSGHSIDVIQNVFGFNLQSGGNTGYVSYSENVTKVAGGAFFEGSSWVGNRGSLVIDADTIMRDTRLGGAEVSCMYEDASANSAVEGGELTFITGVVSGGCTANTNVGVWSNPGTQFTLNVGTGSRIFCNTSASRCFRNVALSICGVSTACNGAEGTNLPSACNIALTDTNLDTAISTTAFGSNAWIGGCGAISKIGTSP